MMNKDVYKGINNLQEQNSEHHIMLGNIKLTNRYSLKSQMIIVFN